MTKMPKILFWILIFLIPVLFFFGYGYYTMRIYNALWEEGYATQKENAENQIARALNLGEYEYAATILSSFKACSESIGGDRERYLEFLHHIRSIMPEDLDMDRLPFDLRMKNEEEVLFGLCSNIEEWRLKGNARDVEIERLASEITSASRSGETDMIDVLSAYLKQSLSPEEWNRIQELTREPE